MSLSKKMIFLSVILELYPAVRYIFFLDSKAIPKTVEWLLNLKKRMSLPSGLWHRAYYKHFTSI